MTFLTWDNQNDAAGSLVAVNAEYGCPHAAENGYRMDQWDTLVSSNDESRWGFYRPVSRLGKTIDALFARLTPGFTEHIDKPAEFYPAEATTD